METVADALRLPRARRSGRGLPHEVAIYAAVAALCIALGTAVARGGPASLALLLLAGGATLAVLFSELRIHAVTAWIALGPLAFPFVRWPAPPDDLLTFDRIWLGGLAGIVLLSHHGVPRSRASRVLGLALVWLVASYGLRVATSPEVLSGLQTWVDGILLPVVLYAAVREVARTERDCCRIAGALALGGLTLAAIGLASKALGFELASLSGGTPRLDASIGLIRISGPYDLPEPYALSLLVCLAGTLYWAQLRRGSALWIGCAIAMLELAAIGLTFFRAAWIGAVVVVVTAFGLRPRHALRAMLTTALVGGVVLAGALVFGGNETITTRVSDTANVYARVATYLQGVEIFREAPLAGVGVHEFAHAQADQFGAPVGGVGALQHPHSTFVSTLAEQGLVGFLPLLAVAIAAWLVIRGLRRVAVERGDVLLAAAAVGAAFSYLIMSFTLTMLPFGPSNALFAIVLGMAASRFDALTAEEHG